MLNIHNSIAYTISSLNLKFYSILIIQLICCFESYANENRTTSKMVYLDSAIQFERLIQLNLKSLDNQTLHIFSHGKPGMLFLNGKWRNEVEIAKFLKSRKLTNFNHMNIFGCEFGKGKKGQKAIIYLEKELNLTISASDDTTGVDGDWELEVGTYACFNQFSSYPYNLQCALNTPAPAALYYFDGNLNDQSVNNRPLTAIDGPATGTNTTPNYTTDAVQGNRALNSQVNSNTVIIESQNAFYNVAYTTRSMSTFVHLNAVNGNGYIYEEGGITNGISLRVNTATSPTRTVLILTVVEDGTSRSVQVDYPNDGNYHQVGFVYDGSNSVNLFWLYLDGYPVGGAQAFGSFNARSTGLSVGNNNSNTPATTSTTNNGQNPFLGYIDEMAVYTQALSPKNMLDIAKCENLDYLSDLVPMSCTNDAYLVQQSTGQWSQVSLATGGSTLGTDNLTLQLNSIGYNSEDNRIWGNVQGPTLATLASTVLLSNGTYRTKVLGPIAGIPNPTTRPFNVGDVKNGKLYLTESTLNIIYVIDLDDTSPTYLQLTRIINLSTFNVADFAFNPVDGKFYGVTTLAPYNLIQYTLDVTTPTSRSLGPAGTSESGGFGAVYADSEGNLYVSNNTSGRIYRLDLSTDPGTNYDETKTVLFTTSTGSTFNDGAMCNSSIIALDFGDAPNSYRTEIGSDGPRHLITNGFDNDINVPGTSELMLGSTIDREIDGQPSMGSDGDSSDEDGIVTVNPMIAGQMYSQQVMVRNAIGKNAYLSAWVDFNADGDFLDSGERIANDQIVAPSATNATISAMVPNAFTTDQISYLRIRICENASDCNLSFGAASNGEVEDYLINLLVTPVELIHFTAKLQKAAVKLSWETASEINNSHFEVERSVHGNHFETIGHVTGSGTTTIAQSYSYIDDNFHYGSSRIFYRLKQVDFDGEFKYSAIQWIQLDEKSNALKLYPNPIKVNELLIVEHQDIREIEVHSIRGQLLFRKLFTEADKVNLPLTGLQSGIYIVRINGEKFAKIVVE